MLKKSQMELIGIAVVVILISLGILFMLSFGVTKKETSFKQEFTDQELVSNTISTFLRIKANGCGDLTMEDLLQDCFLGQVVECNYMSSCNYTEDALSQILDRTLNTWKKSYFMKISRGANTKVYIFEHNCTEESGASWNGVEWKSKIIDRYWIPLDPGTIEVKMGICS